MAFDLHLAERIRLHLQQRGVAFHEKKMMGGLCFLVDDKMLAGMVREDLMARVGIEKATELKLREGCTDMTFTGRSMKGYVFANPMAVDMDEDLATYLDACIAFNPLAKSSKKKSK